VEASSYIQRLRWPRVLQGRHVSRVYTARVSLFESSISNSIVKFRREFTGANLETEIMIKRRDAGVYIQFHIKLVCLHF